MIINVKSFRNVCKVCKVDLPLHRAFEKKYKRDNTKAVDSTEPTINISTAKLVDSLVFSKLSKKKFLKRMALSKKTVKELLPGNVLTVPCDNVAELDSAYQTALTARKEMGMTANELYINRSSKSMSVTITRRKEVVK